MMRSLSLLITSCNLSNFVVIKLHSTCCNDGLQITIYHDGFLNYLNPLQYRLYCFGISYVQVEDGVIEWNVNCASGR